MIEKNSFRKGRSCVFLLHAHLVFIAKYRKNIFKKRHLKALEKIFKKVCTDFDVDLKEFDGEKDHVHLLVNFPPKVSISKLVNSLKGVSSRLLKSEFKDLNQFYWKNALWSPSYFAGSCGGAPLEMVKAYIRNQASPE